MATRSGGLDTEVELVPPTRANEPLLPTEQSLDTITLSEASAQDTSQLDSYSLSAESSKASGGWQLTSYRKENERLRQQLVKLRKSLDTEKEQLKHIKREAQETLVRVRKEERDTARHKQNELHLKLERQNQGQLKSSESHWQSEVVRLQGDMRQLRQETAKLKVQQQNLETAKRRAEEDLRRVSQDHESEIETLRRAGGQDLRKQHDELRSRDKELREKKRDLDHVNERALRMESKVDELEAGIARLKGGMSLDRASPKAPPSSIGDRSFFQITAPLQSKPAQEGAPAEGGTEGDKKHFILNKNAELSSLAHRLDEKVKKLSEEKQDLLSKLRKEQVSSEPLREDNRKLSSKCSDLTSSLRRTEEREKHALGEAKRLKLNQTQLDSQMASVKQELTVEKSKSVRHRLGSQQMERAQAELKRSQGQLTAHKDTIKGLEKEREDLKKRIDLLKHSKKRLSEERDSALEHSKQLISDQNNVIEKEWENASQASFLQAELDQVIFERDELKASIALLHLEHLTLQRANSLLVELGGDTGTRDGGESDLRSQELSRIERELRESSERVGELEDLLAAMPPDSEKSVGMEDLENELNLLTQSLSSTEEQLTAALDKIGELEGEIQVSRRREEKEQLSVKELESKIEDLEEGIKATGLVHEGEVSRVQSEKSKLDERLSDKIKRVSEMEQSLSEAIYVSSQLEARLEQLSSDKIENSTLLEQKSEEAERSNSERQDLETELRSGQQQLATLSEDKNALLNELVELKESVKIPTESKLLERLEEVKLELSTAEGERDQLREILVSKTAGEQELNEKIQDLQEMNNKTKDDNSILLMKADQLGVIECELELNRSELERLRDREQVLEGEIRVLKLQNEDAQLDLKILRKSMNKRIEELSDEKNSLVEAYSLQLSEAQCEIDHLRSSSADGTASVGVATDTPAEMSPPWSPNSPLHSRVLELTQQLEGAQREREDQEREREETLLVKQTELDAIQYNLLDTEQKLADALQSALRLSQEDPLTALDSPGGLSDGEMKRELKAHVEAALLNLREGSPAATEQHLRAVQSVIESLSLSQGTEGPVSGEEFSFSNIIVEIDTEKEMMRQELAEFQEAFSALEEELEETRSALQSLHREEKDLSQKERIIQDLRCQVSDLNLIISSERQRTQRDKSSPGSLGDEHSITASLLDSPQSRFLEPRLFVTLFDYDPLSLCTTGHPERQLPLKAGDIVVVHGDMDATAHYQATHEGAAGLVPANFIEELVISDPLARQRLLSQSLSPDRQQGRINAEDNQEDMYSSSEDENTESAKRTGRKMRIPMCVSSLCVEKVLQDSLLLSWEHPALSASGRSNGAYVLGYRVIVNNEPKKDVIGALQVKCLLEGLTAGVPLTIQVLTLSDDDLASHPCTIQHPPISSSHSRPSTASSHFSLPPSLADTISPATSSSTILEPSHNVVAIYDYNSATDSPNDNHEFELSFKDGDVITVFGCVMEDGFYFGELNGKKGLVPSNFVQEVGDADSHTMDTTRGPTPDKDRPQSSDSQSISASTPDPQFPNFKQVLALYSYDPYTMSPNDNPEIELQFKEGDIIRIQPDMDKYGFYQGEMEGHQGLIPSNFVTELDSSSTQQEQASGVSPLPEITLFSDPDAESPDPEDTPNFRVDKPRKGVFLKGKNFVKKLGRIGSPRNPKA